jgi:anaerobic ribonucleoside-triphosphate reductase activating protein
MSNTASRDYLDFDGYADGVEGLGPGLRAVIWVRGCRRRCPGCIAPELWEPGERTRVDEVAAEIKKPVQSSDGLTITGGEPFDQPDTLVRLIDGLREKQPLEVLVYTGYTLEELRTGSTSWGILLSRIDMLIDGPYLEEADNTLLWRGSDNQRLHMLTQRAKQYSYAVNALMPEPRPLQVRMLSPTRYRVIGIPRRGDLERYRSLTAECRFKPAPGHE